MTRRRPRDLPGALVLLLVTSGSASALGPDKAVGQYVRDVWQTRDGLPMNTIWALAQTADGYLWVGTEEGLARFDGVRFVTFDRTNRGLTSANVQTLLASGHRLFAGTYGGGLLLHEGGVFRAFGPREGLLGESVSALAEDGAGGLWVGTELGLNVFRDGRFTTPRAGASLGAVKKLLRDSHGVLWVGTDRGLSQLQDGATRTYGEQEGLPRATITALHEDGHGVLWVGTDHGLARREGDRFVTYRPADGLADDFVSSLGHDASGALWIGTNGGLQRFTGRRFEGLSSRDGLPTSFVVSMLVGREGGLWVGTRGGGLVLLKDGDFTSYGTRQGLVSEVVDCIRGSRDGSLWVGGSGGHLARLFLDGRIETLPTRDALSGSRIRSLYEDPRGDLWIGTWLGLHVLRDGRISSRTAPGLKNVRVITEAPDGSLWVGTDSSGIFRFQGAEVTHFTTRDGLAGDAVRALLHDAKGRLWIGTYGGLSLFEQGRFTTYTVADGLPGNLVRTLYEDREGALWIGTYGGGLGRLRNGHFDSWSTKDGLFNDVAYEILDDGDNLWMSCNRGIYRVSRRELEDVRSGRTARLQSVRYTESDGLPTQECNGGNPSGWRTADGRLWFLTVSGVVATNPTQLRAPSLPPVPVLEEVVLDGEVVDQARPLEIAPGGRSLEFHYTALDLLAASRLRFRYRLAGFGQGWTEVGARRAVYFTGLPPGQYRLEIAAAREGEAWSELVSSPAFQVLPHFYQTRVFRGLALLAAVGIGLALHRMRVRRMQRRAIELRTEVDAAVAKVEVLSGLLPICAWCKKVRDDQGYWSQIETYVSNHTEAEFTHGICPDCKTAVRTGKRRDAGGS
jgi:ligand-binding sensor domain-containing protein